MTASALYEGTIRHRRSAPGTDFTHAIALAYVDLAELPHLLGGRLLKSGPAPLRFRRRDYLGDPAVPLDVAVRDRVDELTGHRPDGPIRLLTQLRTFGVCFNPVSFYYCFDRDGERMQAVLAEVTNTPWGERYSYALDEPDSGGRLVQGRFAKQLHVSPFMGMDRVYVASATAPGERLAVHIESRRDGRTGFDATLALRRRELTPAAVRHVSARFPVAAARTLALIYGHALGLKLSGARVHPHPRAATR